MIASLEGVKRVCKKVRAISVHGNYIGYENMNLTHQNYGIKRSLISLTIERCRFNNCVIDDE